MTEDQKEYLKKWLLKANEDIAVIDQLSKNQPGSYTGAICYHSQQSVEKFFKAFLVFNNVDFRKTHDLDYLLNECLKIDKKGFTDIDLKSLSDYGVSVRYPDDFYIPDLKETQEYIEIALFVKDTVERKINL